MTISWCLIFRHSNSSCILCSDFWDVSITVFVQLLETNCNETSCNLRGVQVAKQGEGDMAVCNALGSNAELGVELR